MINQIIEYSGRNRGIIVVLVAMLVFAGLYAMRQIPLDAIPDLSDPQVIIYTEWPGRSPNLVEDQITYPVVSAMLAAPRVSAVRGISDFGFSYVYVIFEEGTDIYWGRSRVLEYMSKITGKLPEGVSPRLGPDATGVGWAFQYALVDKTGTNNLAQLRSFNDWYMRYWLESVPGVAEVATVGGFVKQYQVSVDPNKLRAYNIPINKLMQVIHDSNSEVGGRVVEMSGKEYLVRGRGYIQGIQDIEKLSLGTDGKGTPILIGDVARVELGPDMRRGVAEFNGEGEVTGGIVVVRFGQNVMNVIQAVKQKIEEVRSGLPKGVDFVVTYDRSDLIERSIDTLKHTLIEELIIVSVVILIFLWHVPSAVIPIVTIPIAVILSFIPMYGSGVTSNIMSLGGIAIAIGAMVDAAIVVVEQTHKKLEHWEAEGRHGSAQRVIIDAVKEVGGPSFFSLLVIAVSFMPIFALQYQEGRLFKPLAFTKNFSMAIAAVLAITLDPAMRLLFMRTQPFAFRPRWLARMTTAILVGRIHSEENHPISRPLMRIYHPVVRFVLNHKWLVITAAMILVALTVPVYLQLGSEFMPPLNEGTILYMPITLPGISVTEATKYLQIQDKLLMQFPEVQSVFGKIGKSETATDPAPMSMVETTVVLKPEKQWRHAHRDRWYSRWSPEFLKPPLRRFWPEDGPIGWEQLIEEMDRTVQIPTFANAWLFPIRTRIDMITTGIRTPVGIKVLGPDLDTIEKIGLQLEKVLQPVAGTRSAFFERVTGGYYLDFQVRREEAARYGLSVGEIQDVIESAIGGATATTTVEGRERYSVNVRYSRDFRTDISNLNRVLVATPDGAQIPITQLADITLRTGPSMIKNEEGFPAGFVYVDVTGRDMGRYVEEAKRIVSQNVQLPAGYHLVWSGQYEYLQRVVERLRVVVPITLFIVFLLLYFNTGSFAKTVIILLAVPFSAIGAIWLLYLLNYNMSIAVWVGLIALLGVDAETAVFMLLYLDLAYNDRKAKGQMRNITDLKAAIEDGAVKRLRPKVMTVAVMFMGLVPIMWSTGAGSDVMRRIAAPMIGGIFTSFILELVVYPAIYEIWKGREVRRLAATEPSVT
ncbi:MAG: CusA/CzcA family heavy metal efflux RND transporter [Acidobacteria bacterium]|nr:MAG: CusA/CzcA family heavy metal efflux RND transporter [Acidobacteriota bacterium]